MDLNEQISYLLASKEHNDNLSEVRDTIAKLNLAPSYPIILVGGTNGKGSVCAYLSTILTLGGYKVGSFTSPHIFNYNERISINNEHIRDNDLSNLLNQVINASTQNLGLFKTFTLASHLHFIQQKIDIAIIEVGIGGLNDVTNLFEPAISIITSIDYDHCQILGNTLDLISEQKAGIFRANKPAIIGIKNPPQKIIDCAAKINARLQIIDTDFGYTKHELSFDFWSSNSKLYSLPHPALRGMEQLANVSVALAALNELKPRFPLALSSIKTAMLQIRLPGRFTIVPGQPQIILDVAHNPQAVSQMLVNMLKLPFAKYSYAVFGIANDKDIGAITQLTKKHFDKWFIAPINSTRRIDNEKLAKIMQDAGIDKSLIVANATINDAFIKAKSISTNNDRIVCFGSFLVVEEAYKCN